MTDETGVLAARMTCSDPETDKKCSCCGLNPDSGYWAIGIDLADRPKAQLCAGCYADALLWAANLAREAKLVTVRAPANAVCGIKVVVPASDEAISEPEPRCSGCGKAPDPDNPGASRRPGWA